MKKILFILTLFFISPFVTHASVTHSVVVDYTNNYNSYFNSYSPVGESSYKEVLSTIISHYKSKNKKFMIKFLPKTSSRITVYTFDDVSTLKLISNPDNNPGKVNSGLYIESSASNISSCQFINLHSSSYNKLSEQLSYCDSVLEMDNLKTKTANVLDVRPSDDGYYLYKNSDGTFDIPYYINFEFNGAQGGDNVDYMIHSPLGTFGPFIENNTDLLFYSSYYSNDLILENFFPKVTFTYDYFNTNKDNKITSVGVSANLSSYRDTVFEYYYKSPRKDEFDSFFGATSYSPSQIIYTDTNGDIVVKIKEKQTGLQRTWTFKVDVIGKDASVLKDLVSDTVYENGVQEDTPLIGSVIQKWFDLINKNFPIIKEVGSLLDIFKSNNYDNAVCPNSSFTGFSSSSGSYCLPVFKANFSFIGINKDFNIINYDFYFKYRDFIFTLISSFVAFITFLKVINSLERIFKQ